VRAARRLGCTKGAITRFTATAYTCPAGAKLTKVQTPILVEQGFWTLYASMQLIGPTGAALGALAPAITNAAGSTGMVTVVGHSFGPALATYLTLDLARGGLGACLCMPFRVAAGGKPSLRDPPPYRLIAGRWQRSDTTSSSFGTASYGDAANECGWCGRGWPNWPTSTSPSHGSCILGRVCGLPSSTRGRSRVREFRSHGSVRGALSNERPYREQPEGRNGPVRCTVDDRFRASWACFLGAFRGCPSNRRRCFATIRSASSIVRSYLT
jgi:hypothetical protein